IDSNDYDYISFKERLQRAELQRAEQSMGKKINNMTLPSTEIQQCLETVVESYLQTFQFECERNAMAHWQQVALIDPNLEKIGCCSIWSGVECLLKVAK